MGYRGYFSEQGARDFAASLEADGYDVYTGGVAAYSTLGWFDDPVLSTVINRPDYQLAALIFHELAHQLVYVPGDTPFNEGFATLMEREGLRRWLQQQGDAATLERAEADAQRRQQFVQLVIDYRSRFQALYESELEARVMRERKNALQQAMREDYQALKLGWGGLGSYDAWFAGSLNNAQLSTVSSYNDLVPGFQRLLNEAEGDLSAFYGRVQQLAELNKDERAEKLQTE